MQSPADKHGLLGYRAGKAGTLGTGKENLHILDSTFTDAGELQIAAEAALLIRSGQLLMMSVSPAAVLKDTVAHDHW